MKDYIEGSGNVFKDLRCSNPEEKQAKAELISIINKIIKNRNLTQKNAANILGIDQPKISALKHGQLSGFSIERLFFFLRALDQCIDITIQREPKDASNNMIHVAYA